MAHQQHLKIIVHIGMEKTGTSTIQEFLYQNRENLLANGFYPLKTPGRRDNRDLPSYCMRDDRYDDFFNELFIQDKKAKQAFQTDFVNRFDDEITNLPSNIHTVIASSEHFHSRTIFKDEIETLKNLLDRYFNDIKILTYLRKQVDTAVSLYSTLLKSGQTLDFENFVMDHCRPDNYYFDYYQYIKNWEEIFGKTHITIRIFETDCFVNNNLIDDFISQIDSPDCQELTNHVNKNIELKNESINHLGQVLIKIINKQIPKFQDDMSFNKANHLIVKTIVERTAGKGINLSTEKYHAVQAKFDELNEHIRKEYFPCKDVLFQNIPPQTRNEILSKEQEALLDDVIGMLLNKSINPLPDFYADILRSSAIALEQTDVNKSYHLMKLASDIRPNGLVIRKKLNEYKARIQLAPS